MSRDSISNQPTYISTEIADAQREKWQQEYKKASPEKQEIMKVNKDIESKKEELSEISRKEAKIKQEYDPRIEKYKNAKEKINDELGELFIKKSKLITKLLNSRTAPAHEKQVFIEMRKKQEKEAQLESQRVDVFNKFGKSIAELDHKISNLEKEKSRLQKEVNHLSTIENVFSDIGNLTKKKENIGKWNLVKKIILRGENKIKRLERRINNNYRYARIELAGGQKSINGRKSLLFNSIVEKTSLDGKIKFIVDRKELLTGQISNLEGQIAGLQTARKQNVDELNRVLQNDQRDFKTIQKESVNKSVNINKNVERVPADPTRQMPIKGG